MVRFRDFPQALAASASLFAASSGINREALLRRHNPVVRRFDALMMETEKNRYLANGRNWQRDNLPCYLAGNGGLLYAAALMAAGWRGAPRKHAPGFPADGSWTVTAEGFRRQVLSRV